LANLHAAAGLSATASGDWVKVKTEARQAFHKT
jgi:hypothetical protein